MTDPKWENGACPARLPLEGGRRPFPYHCPQPRPAPSSRRAHAGSPISGEAVLPVVLTGPSAAGAGTERCLEILRKLQSEGKDFDIVVNIQVRPL